MLVCSIDELIEDFDKYVDLENLDEFGMLQNMVNIELPTDIHKGIKLLNETNNRYKRYLLYINSWDDFGYIKEQIHYFIYNPSNDINKKLKMMKEIDLELYNIVCYLHNN
jgi:hypothetical protein